ncbi:MAG: 16S rRNA (guanine(966)-N(2))-methyltransferase RsmD [Oleiphilaceae bacterium]|nr:16S rRNA (guanine(966)-N(2))-methyltransferase RsmD [Oleiphilaceae bacterium]
MAAGRKKNRDSKKNATGEYRLISGKWRSRRLAFPEVDGLRPTTDRVRETVFSWLQAYIPGAKVLDVFAGSGALGYEALSRGASEVTMIEKHPVACRYLEQNAALLGAKPKIIKSDALAWLQQNPSDRFDLIFLDPPFRHGLLNEVIGLLELHAWCAPQARIYVERAQDDPAIDLPEHWQIVKEKQAGQVCYALLAKAGESE